MRMPLSIDLIRVSLPALEKKPFCHDANILPFFLEMGSIKDMLSDYEVHHLDCSVLCS